MKHYKVHIANCFKLIWYKILILINLILQTKCKKIKIKIKLWLQCVHEVVRDGIKLFEIKTTHLFYIGISLCYIYIHRPSNLESFKFKCFIKQKYFNTENIPVTHLSVFYEVCI